MKKKSKVPRSCIWLQATPQRNAARRTFKSVVIQCAMENIEKLALPRIVKIFIFTDDITVVVTRNNQLIDAQEALNIIKRECHRLGLKINPAQTKAMAVKHVNLGRHLSLEQQRIEWVKHYHCLGIWIDAKLSFRKQVEYLRKRTSARLAPMRHITSWC